MEENAFFGEEEGALSPVTLVVTACVADFANAYQARSDGNFTVVENGQVACWVREDEVIADIQGWIKELQYGENAITDKVISLVRSNPGWGAIIARRVIRELRKWAT